MLFGKFTVNKTNNYFRTFTGTGIQPAYWLASNYVYSGEWAFGRTAYWGIRYVNNGSFNENFLHDSYGLSCGTGNGSFGVRPVVTLKSDTTLEWNDTAKEWKIK